MPLTLGAVLWGRTADAFGRRAAALEALGFGSFSVGDHLGHFPALTACAAVATATHTARVGPLVLNNDFRHPSVVAREAAALADLSGGRFELGLGAGYAKREYDRAGLPYDPGAVRIARLGESARILSELLSGAEVTFVGEHYRVEGDSIPWLAHQVPLLIGGNHPAVHAIAGRDAEILNLTGLSSRLDGTVEDLADFDCAALARQVEALQRLARDRAHPLERHVLVQWHHVTGHRAHAAEHASTALGVPPETVLDSPYVLLGTPEEIAAQLRDHHDRFGITRWTVFADRLDLQPAEELAPVIAALGQ